MASLPQSVRDAWEDRDGPAILATVDQDGVPNIVYVTCVSTWRDDHFVVADNYFDKTRKNIQEGCKGCLLFIDKAGKAYQAKGVFGYHTEGEVFDHMKTFNPSKHPGHAAVGLLVEEVYSGAEKLC